VVLLTVLVTSVGDVVLVISAGDVVFLAKA
jgi:hypothetical protein